MLVVYALVTPLKVFWKVTPLGNTDDHTGEQGFKSSLGMSYRVAYLIVDGEQRSNIKKVVHLSLGDSILRESSFQ